MAVDECGQLYLFDMDENSKMCKLYRYECGTQNLEHLSHIICSNSCLENVHCPQRILLSKHNLWVNDTINKRVVAFSREDYQIKNVIDKLNDETIEPVDVGLDECGDLYVLIKKFNNYLIAKYDNYGYFINSFELNLEEAIGLACGKKNILYVIDRKKKRLLKYINSHQDSSFSIDLSKYDISDIKRSGIVIDKKGNIFLSYCKKEKALIHQFDSDGSSLGIVKCFTGTVQGLAVDCEGNLYISCNKGICKFETQNRFTKEIGTYYSKTLDSGISSNTLGSGIIACQWHRMALETDIPPKTTVEISYSSSDDQSLKEKIDFLITDTKISKQERAREIDKELKWSEPEKFASNSPNLKEKDLNSQINLNEPEKNQKNMLFRGKQGRYLWLKIKLLTFDENVSPAITQMKIHYPHISYLRYLPAIYQEDPTSKDFLERFLSIFETAYNDLETKINYIYKYFDPKIAPPNFLDWLASWLNVAFEEDWKDEKKREFLQEAYNLYKQKGTPSGITRIIEIYTGKKPVLLEYSKIKKPIVLRDDGTFRLGVNSLLLETPFSGLRLGDECILGRIVLRDSVRLPEEPFLPMAHRFTIMLDLSDDEKILFEKQLRRILDEVKPAHTMYNLSFSSSIEETGTSVGNTKLDYYRHLRLGAGAKIGSVVIVTDRERGGRIEESSIVGVDTELV